MSTDTPMGLLLRETPDAFDALRDAAADRFAVDPGAVEKDYWATEVLRSATAPLDGVEAFVFKGGTSLSKAYGLIERFSEDIDLLVISGQRGNRLKRLLRDLADRTSGDLRLEYEREHEGAGYLNARYTYAARRQVVFLTSGVLLEMGTRGGPLPNEERPLRSLMAATAAEVDPTAVTDYADLGAFDVIVLAPERTLAEKLAFLHHRASVRDLRALSRGARHLYDVAMLLGSDRVRTALDGGVIAELMVDVDERSAAAGWAFTARPDGGFSESIAFSADPAVAAALRQGYDPLPELVWGTMPSFDEAIGIIKGSSGII